MRQCINTYCLHSQDDEAMYCNQCGCQFFVDERLVATRRLSHKGPFSTPRTQTFEAFDVETKQLVILRVVDSEQPFLVEPLKLAIQVLNMVHANGSHPGIMQLVNSNDYYFTARIRLDDPAAHFMVAKKVEGVSLTEWMKQHGPISETLAKNWLRQLLQAVEKLHDLEFMHRDIKPDNIIVSPDYQLVLVDFDTIYRLTNRYAKVPRIGTGAYMAPEQSNGTPLPTSDLYSIGQTMCELLTGKFPSDISRTSNQLVDWDEEAPKLSKAFTQFIDRLANENTLFRPPSVSEALDYLALTDAAPPQIRPWSWLRTPLTTTAFTIFAVSLSIGAIGTLALSQIPTSRTTPEQEQSEEVDGLLAEGNQLILMGATSEGLALIEEALVLEPDSVELLSSLAIAQAFLGNYEAAIDNYNKILEIEPEDPFALYNLANVYEEVDMQQAISYYIAASEIDSPIRLDALNNLARVYLLAGQLELAEETLANINLDIEDPFTQMTVFKNLGWLNYQQGNFMLAKQHLQEAIEADSTHPDPYCLMALIQEELGEDNRNDKITCIHLRVSIEKPELDVWKEQLQVAGDD